VTGTPALTIRHLAGVSCPHGVTGRDGGVSHPPFDSLNLGLHVDDRADHVLENRRRLAGSLGVDALHLTFSAQVHGAGVAVVGSAERGRGALDHADSLPGADALVTATADIPLVMLGADCVLIVLHDPGAPALAVAHAGWRGAVGGVVEATIEVMVGRFGARPERLEAALTPAIGVCCYEVGAEVTRAFPGTHVVTDAGRSFLDLPGAVTARLLRAGVRRVGASAQCTACRPDASFSYRSVGGTPTGRHAVVAWLPA
jgi:purine-nucleoside/S-methyl-5'-thioadenosine phosphorylase / adenosine deaminase